MKIQLRSCETLNSCAFSRHLEGLHVFSRHRRQRGTRQGCFPDTRPQTWPSGWRATAHPPGGCGACFRDLAGVRALHGRSQGDLHPESVISCPPRREANTCAQGRVACNVHVRECPRAQGAAPFTAAPMWKQPSVCAQLSG